MNRTHDKLCFVLLFLASLTASAWGQQSATPTPSEVKDWAPTDDPKEIVRRAFQVDQQNFELARNYTCQQRVAIRAFDKKGTVKHREIKTYDITILYGEPYSRMIQKDDKPLSEKDERKEAEKLDKFIAKHKNENDRERAQRLAKEEKQRREGRAFAGDIVNAYNFQMAGTEQIDGQEVYVIEATPRKDFHATQRHADILSKIKGKLWIENKEYGWVKIEAETTDSISFGLFVARIHKGSRLRFEQVRLNDEIWLPRRISVNASARVMLFMNGGFDWESDFSNYKKFTTAARILPGTSVVEPTPSNSDPRK